MTSKGGFTLVEVMAAVLVLGLLYTVLASSAMREWTAGAPTPR
jgi:prepilin-type N-terminal cleavage/methylation domain-containing protein